MVSVARSISEQQLARWGICPSLLCSVCAGVCMSDNLHHPGVGCGVYGVSRAIWVCCPASVAPPTYGAHGHVHSLVQQYTPGAGTIHRHHRTLARVAVCTAHAGGVCVVPQVGAACVLMHRIVACSCLSRRGKLPLCGSCVWCGSHVFRQLTAAARCPSDMVGCGRPSTYRKSRREDQNQRGTAGLARPGNWLAALWLLRS